LQTDKARTAGADRLAFADALRGLSAAVVVVGHFFFVFLSGPELVAMLISAAPYSAGTVPSWANQFYSTFNLAAMGVAVFFLISGFVIPMSLDGGGALGFWIKRFMRIFPTYWVALGAGILAILLSGAYWSRPVPYGALDYFVNFFLITDFFGRIDIPSVMWTLTIEIKFYLLAPLFHWLLRRNMVWGLPAWSAIVLLLYWLAVGSCSDAVPACWGHRGPISRVAWEPMMIGYMLIGSMFYAHYRGLVAAPVAALGVAAIFGLFAASWPLSPFAMHGNSYILAYFWGVLIFGSCYLLRSRIRLTPALKFLADISYPLYIVHPLVGYTLMRMMIAWNIPYPAALACALATVVLFAWLIHVFVEAPAMALGKTWAKRLSARKTRPAAAQ
jgi:peptidoglycan/LPS O-acetylase OafA/YrhL